MAHVAPPLKNKAYKNAINKAKMGKKKSFYKKYYEVAALEKKDFSYLFVSFRIFSCLFVSFRIFSYLFFVFNCTQRRAKKTKNKKVGFKRFF